MNQGCLGYRTQATAASPPAPTALLGADVTAHVPEAPGSPVHPAGRRYLVWGMGGTLLSIIGFIGMLLFEQYNGLVAELRADLKHFNEIQSEFVKKENLRRFSDRIRDFSKDVQASNAARAQMEQELRASERAREEMGRELQRLRERLASVEGRQAATPVAAPAISAPVSPASK
jgi:hypothetical protein